jgi:hypothetical protein
MRASPGQAHRLITLRHAILRCGSSALPGHWPQAISGARLVTLDGGQAGSALGARHSRTTAPAQLTHGLHMVMDRL